MLLPFASDYPMTPHTTEAGRDLRDLARHLDTDITSVRGSLVIGCAHPLTHPPHPQVGDHELRGDAAAAAQSGPTYINEHHFFPHPGYNLRLLSLTDGRAEFRVASMERPKIHQPRTVSAVPTNPSTPTHVSVFPPRLSANYSLPSGPAVSLLLF